jgi:hypothetical protein
MKDFRYPNGVEELRDPLRVLVDKLHREIGQEFELWIRIEDFARRISVGVLNSQRSAVILVVARCGRVCREIDSQVFDSIRAHLRSASNEDLTLTLV